LLRLLYFKCHGGGKVSGYLLAALTSVFFFVGPSVIHFVPRCMAGCLLIHVGIDLMTEALVDSYGGFDRFEYASIVLITATMTAYGMTAGLGAGVVLATPTGGVGSALVGWKSPVL
jgi:sulfate permease, SulP family